MNDQCDSDVYSNGKVIAVLSDVCSDVVDAWVKHIAAESGQKVDWHYMSGRAIVKATGDLEKVDSAAYLVCILNGRLSCMFGKPTLRGLGGAISYYGYFPGGENHWSNSWEEEKK